LRRNEGGAWFMHIDALSSVTTVSASLGQIVRWARCCRRCCLLPGWAPPTASCSKRIYLSIRMPDLG